MSLKKRIIVTLLHDGKGQALKPIGYSKDRRPVGSLMQHIKVLAKRNIDELVLMDACACEEHRRQNLDLIREVTAELTCPVTIGGGIGAPNFQLVPTIRELLNNGADKILFCSFASEENIKEASQYIGSQSVVCELIFEHDLTKVNIGGKLQLMALVSAMHAAGMGELILSNVLRDGHMKGYDLDLIKFFKEYKGVSIINSGCGSKEHMLDAFNAGAEAVAASSLFLFTDTTPRDCAEFLAKHNVAVRNEPIVKWSKAYGHNNRDAG